MLNDKAEINDLQALILQVLVKYGILPDPISGNLLQQPPLVQLLNESYLNPRQYTGPLVPMHEPWVTYGTDSLDAKPEVPTMPPSILEMVTTERSNLTYKLGVALAETDILISTLTRFRGDLHKFFTSVGDGVPGLDAVDNSGLDDGRTQVYQEQMKDKGRRLAGDDPNG